MASPDTSNELYVYRFRNGIKLLHPFVTKHDEFIEKDSIQTIAKLMDLPFSVYFENVQQISIKCNEICAEQCGFQSTKEIIGVEWFKKFKSKTIAQSIATDKELIQNEDYKITEEKLTRKDHIDISFLNIKMPWYDSNNKVVGLFGCSIILNEKNIADALLKIAKLGLLRACDDFLPGKTINSLYFTKREIECLQGAIKGKTVKDIAKELGISHRTVEEYMANLKRKIQVKSKSELIEKGLFLLRN